MNIGINQEIAPNFVEKSFLFTFCLVNRQEMKRA